ncbi:MAG TPA: protein kinase [Candidatus Krumholzibacteria bacterium]|nr:protein kinase [Candidatus Krumholzibacteria bacterium]
MTDPAARSEDLAAQLARKATEFETLQRVSWEINATLDLEEIYDLTLETMATLFAFHHATILLLEDDQETLTVVASRGYENQAIGGRVKVGTGVIGMVAKRRRMLHLSNLGQTRAYVSAQRREMVKAGRAGELGDTVTVPGLPNAESQIALPLLVKDALIGVFSIESPVPRTFGPHDEALVTIVANQVASAIHNARLVRAETTRMRELADEKQRAAEALQRVNDSLEIRVRERTAELERELRVARELLDDARKRVEGPLLGQSAAVQGLHLAIRQYAQGDPPLLLVGATGSGREAAARSIHHESSRRGGAFIQVDCTLLHAHDRSKLLGSLDPEGREIGKMRLATGGVLYLDGVHGLPLELQDALGEEIERIEATREKGETPDPDVRFIASSHRDLAAEIRAERFDARLGRILLQRSIPVPPLVARREDIPALAEHFLRKHARRLGRNADSFSTAALERLQAYAWPGNIRELRTVVERAILMSSGPVVEIDAEHFAGSKSLGSYRLVRQIGAGGMGEVWLGQHQLLARPAAIKLIRQEVSSGKDRAALTQRFQREAQVTAKLRSPHTVELYDFGVGDDSTFYYVMELLVGMDLKSIVERFGPLPPERVVMLLAQACLSLAEAHEMSLVHRDIKPANLFVTHLGSEFDYLKVLDFGMVKVEPGEETLHLSVHGIVQGTPAFIAPEAVLAAPDIDGRADLYSLGCAAYWLLTGRPVFEVSTATSMLIHHVQKPPRPPSAIAEQSIPSALDALVLRCLEKEARNRPDNAVALLEELRRIPFERPWTNDSARHWWQLHAPEALHRLQS